MTAPELMPDLQLAPMERIKFHEHPEERRTRRLLKRIEGEMLLRNPPIVADMENGDFLLLDGANRVGAFKELGLSHIPVQVVDYGDKLVQLKGWHHLLVNSHSLNLASVYGALPGVKLRPIGPERLAHLLELRQLFAILVDGSASCMGLFPEEEERGIEIHDRIRVLGEVVAVYEGQTRLERIKLADFTQLPEVVRGVEHQLCLYPVFTKSELLQVAAKNTLIPTGLSRHLIPGRALGLNLELGFLREMASDEEKSGHFLRYVDRLKMEGKIRYYEEAVFVLNE